MPSDELTLEAGPLALAVERLVCRVRAGEAAAFHELFDSYHGLVFRMGCHLLGDRDEAADLAQEVFLVVYRRIDSLRNSLALRAWLCRITVTRARNRQRHLRRRRNAAHVTLSPGPDSDELAIDLPASGLDPEATLLQEESRLRVASALETVPFRYRAAVIMRDIEGLTYDEIAVSLSVRPGTVKSRIARGREELRRALLRSPSA